MGGGGSKDTSLDCSFFLPNDNQLLDSADLAGSAGCCSSVFSLPNGHNDQPPRLFLVILCFLLDLERDLHLDLRDFDLDL